MKLTMTKGLPASGKSTWAKREVDRSNGKIKRVNKDDLRAMIDTSLWSKTNEKHILSVRDMLVRYYLTNGYDVIVDDTNLTPNHEEVLREIAGEQGADFEVKSFLDVPIGTCIARNAERTNPVPVTAIKSMFRQFVKPSLVKPYIPPVLHNPDLPNCIIVDIDGTVAHMNGRSPYDYTKVSTDTVDDAVRALIQKYAFGPDFDTTHIVIVSGRDNTCRSDTEQWLKDNQIPYAELYMRDPERKDENGNKIDDTVIKREIYEEWIKPRFNVLFVLDDRDRVVKMWREQGLKVLQVEEGDF